MVDRVVAVPVDPVSVSRVPRTGARGVTAATAAEMTVRTEPESTRESALRRAC